MCIVVENEWVSNIESSFGRNIQKKKSVKWEVVRDHNIGEYEEMCVKNEGVL